MYIRHTMGQDQAKPAPWNPPGCEKITKEMVLDAAADAGVRARRDGLERMWWIKRPGDVWRTFQPTHYLAWIALKEMATASAKRQRARASKKPHRCLRCGAGSEWLE